MSRPTAVVLGAGSIGARHARNLVALGVDVTVMDPDLDRAADVPDCVAAALDLDRLGAPDMVVIASPTVWHARHLEAALASTDAKILVEKPLCLLDDDHDALATLGAGRVMVGFNLRFHDPVQQAAEFVTNGSIGRPLSYRLWFGSWLPDWRPQVDYRTTYSARRELGGGILLDAIHELDEARWLAGDLDVRGAFVGAVGPLELDVEDTVKAELRTAAGVPVDISLDYLSRRYRRGVEVIGSDATLRLDWASQTLVTESADESTAHQADWNLDHSYEREAARLLEFARTDTPPPVDAFDGARTMALAGAIHAAATSTVTP